MKSVARITAPPVAWMLYGAVIAVSLLWALQVHVIYGWNDEGFIHLNRYTARTSVCLFAVTFTAAPLHQLFRNTLTKSLIQNRRYWGLSFVLAHLIHLISIVLTIVELQIELNILALIVGCAAYVVAVCMALTSNNYSQRKLGKNWRRLHLFGCWYIWTIFAIEYARRFTESPMREPVWVFGAWSLIVMLVPFVRVTAWIKKSIKIR